jgi:hypothetical protein
VACLGSVIAIGSVALTSPYAAAAGHPASSSSSSSGKGFFLASQSKVSQITSLQNPAAFAEDTNGNQHVITTKQSKSASGNQGHFVYLTRRNGEQNWVKNNVPGLHPLSGGVQVQELVDSGRRIDAVFYTCAGVFVTDASSNSKRLPEPTQISTTTCGVADGSKHSATSNGATPASSQPIDEPPIQHAIALGGNTIGVLLPDPSQGGLPAIWSGEPGGSFTPGPALPTADSFVPVQIAVDPAQGTEYAVGTGVDANNSNRGIYVTTLPLFATSWTDPVRIATLKSTTENYKIEALTSFDSSTFVGLYRPNGDTTNPKNDLFFVHGLPSGEWGGITAVPHTTTEDRDLRLTINTETGTLHAAWTRLDPKSQRGIMQDSRGDNGWTKPKVYTSHNNDVAEQIAFNLAGHAVIGFEQS